MNHTGISFDIDNKDQPRNNPMKLPKSAIRLDPSNSYFSIIFFTGSVWGSKNIEDIHFVSFFKISVFSSIYL